MKKQCRLCDKEKPMDDFYKSKSSKDGRIRICKVCKNAELGQITKCRSCGTEKRASEYYRSTTGIKRMTVCKDCFGPRPDRRQTPSVWKSDPVDYKRICGHLNQQREGLSDKTLVALWNLTTDFYLPRESNRAEAFKPIA